MRLRNDEPRPARLKWLLGSDPAIRWQVMRDLTGEAPDAIAAERSRVVTEGWGAQLLALQSPAGTWGGSPRGWRDDLPEDDRGMLITLYALVELKDLGLDPDSRPARKMIDRVHRRVVFKRLNNRPFLQGETEPCINGRILGLGSCFKEPNDALVFRSLRTGEVIDKRWLRFSFPTFWHYDVLRGLDYLRNAGIQPDSRVNEAIEILTARSHQNGRWPLNLLHPEHVPLQMETVVGTASRWNTLRALRVLRWYRNSME